MLTGPDGKPVTAMGQIFCDTFDPIGIEDARTFVIGNEGNKPWMYGDGDRNVTIGFGHLVENLGEAQELNLVHKTTNAPATAVEIEHDFEAAESGTSDIADGYEEDAVLRLAAGEDSRLFSADFPVHLKIADDFFPLEDLPPEVQIAMFDLAFQIGSPRTNRDGSAGGLQEIQYRMLHRALRRHDWAEAGEQMDVEDTPNRGPIRPVRTDETSGNVALVLHD